MCRMCTRAVVGWPKSFLTNTDGHEYDSSIMLMEVLEERTGNQGWFVISDDARDIYGDPVEGYKALHAYDSRAWKLYHHMRSLPELQALACIGSPISDEPKLSNCEKWDAETKRGLTALYWRKQKEQYETWLREDRWSIWVEKAEEARQKANEALSGSTEVTCDCGVSHSHPGTPISLPTLADIRKMIEKIVDKHLVPFLEKDRQRG